MSSVESHLICEPARCLGRGWRAFSGNIPHRASVGLAPLYVYRTAMGIHQSTRNAMSTSPDLTMAVHAAKRQSSLGNPAL